jgi:hypothetical protein
MLCGRSILSLYVGKQRKRFIQSLSSLHEMIDELDDLMDVMEEPDDLIASLVVE